ncbi:MAG: hypothetical protein M1838_000674 [Thelocarpon superellum]|nr:MAG: hypothetical protein M1838_000674 [Thelocarpon superellum]
MRPPSRRLLCARQRSIGRLERGPGRPGLQRCRTTQVASQRCYATVSAAELQFGQPLHETHPHLLKAGEVTPGISAHEYAQRRAKLAAKLPDGAVAVLAAAEVKYRSGAVFYEFHQESNFFYLTGFNEPEAAALIEKTGPDGEHIFHLYVRPKDAKAELWDGARSGVQAATDVFNADEAGDIKQLPRLLPDMVTAASEVFTDLAPRSRTTSAFTKFLGTPAGADGGLDGLLRGKRVQALRPLLNELRVWKSEAEISNMRAAGRASGRAITAAMRQKFSQEHNLAAFLDYHFKVNGCDGSAYVPVVAGGTHALSIHYVRNDDVLREGELVLVDAGGERGGYITDITRTWPVAGQFSPAQRDLYEALLRVQRTCVALCREDANLSLDGIHATAEKGLRDQLTQLGFDMSRDALEILFPHHVGHYVGLDVHDTSGYSRHDGLKTSQCVTIEPGVYVPDEERWPEHFRGLGIRIEDSVCVQPTSPLVLTTEAVKEVVDIEALAER